MTTFRDRTHAGAVLAEELAFVVAGADVLVCALPRGGVPVAVPVAERLGAQLDAVIVRKIRTPGQPELAMGAVARLGDIVVAVRADEIAARIGLGSAAFDAAVDQESAATRDLDVRYRSGRPAPDVTGRQLVLVDDGLATGASMIAAVRLARQAGAARTVVAVPVGSRPACAVLGHEADDVVCPVRPQTFGAVSRFYANFDPPSDQSVRDALESG